MLKLWHSFPDEEHQKKWYSSLPHRNVTFLINSRALGIANRAQAACLKAFFSKRRGGTLGVCRSCESYLRVSNASDFDLKILSQAIPTQVHLKRAQHRSHMRLYDRCQPRQPTLDLTVGHRVIWSWMTLEPSYTAIPALSLTRASISWAKESGT